MEQIVFELQKISSGNRFCKQGGLFQENNKSVWPVTDSAKPGRSPRSLRLGRFFGPRPPDRPARPPIRDPRTRARGHRTRHREPRTTAREPGTASPERWPPGANQAPRTRHREPGATATGTRTTDPARARDTGRTDQGPSGPARGPGTADQARRWESPGTGATATRRDGLARQAARKAPGRARRSRAAWWWRPPGKRARAARKRPGGDTGKKKARHAAGLGGSGNIPGRGTIRARGLGPGRPAWRRRWPPRRPGHR